MTGSKYVFVSVGFVQALVLFMAHIGYVKKGARLKTHTKGPWIGL